MQAHIVSGGTQAERKNFIDKKCKEQTTELIHLVAEKTSLTIKQVQDLLIPLSKEAAIPRLIWIEEANLLTIPAQNALLKMLEEPPKNTNFYLTCQSQAMLLPTIRSRCELLTIKSEKEAPDSTLLSELKEVMSQTPGDRLAGLPKRDRTEWISYFKDLEYALKEKLKTPKLSSANYQMLAKIAQSALDTHLAVASNVSISLATQTFYLLLPHTRSTK